MRPVALMLLLASALAAEEGGLTLPLTSFRARELREEGTKHWQSAETVWEKLKATEAVDAATAGAALEKVELAFTRLEQSLELEWDAATNTLLANAARAWYALHPLAPPPAEKELAKLKSRRIADVRRFALEYGAARRYESQIQRCSRCDGRGVLSGAFGDKPPPCGTCKQRGGVPVRKGILAARWFVQSPLFRDDNGNALNLDRDLRQAAIDPSRLSPYVKSVAIHGEVEDHGTWARVRVREKVSPEPGGKSEERKETLTLFRIGSRWYIWSRRYDESLIAIPEETAGGT
ncbi:MAG: hypothetical protein ACT4PV_04095 [Planctomycetaceae bacterium]